MKKIIAFALVTFGIISLGACSGNSEVQAEFDKATNEASEEFDKAFEEVGSEVDKAFDEAHEENPENLEGKVDKKLIDSKIKAQIKLAKAKLDKNVKSVRLELLTPEINAGNNQLKFRTRDIDENKVTFIYVANKKVFEQKIKNNKDYPLDITNVKDAHRTDYRPKVQLVQYSNDDEDNDLTTFKQVRYSVTD